MTPELRAARDRLARYADPDFPMPALGMPDGAGPFTAAEVKRLMNQAMRGVQETLAPDLRAALAELDRYDAMDEAVRRDVRQVAAEAGFGPVPDRVEVTYATAGPRGQCEGCGCCVASGCHRFADSTCPTNSLGDSVCPCTES